MKHDNLIPKQLQLLSTSKLIFIFSIQHLCGLMLILLTLTCYSEQPLILSDIQCSGPTEEDNKIFNDVYSADKILEEYFSKYDLASTEEIAKGCLKWRIVSTCWLANRNLFELSCDCWLKGRTYDALDENKPGYPYSIVIFPNSKGKLVRLNELEPGLNLYFIKRGDKELLAFNKFLDYAEIQPKKAFREELAAIFIYGVAHTSPGEIPYKLEIVKSDEGKNHLTIFAHYNKKTRKFDFLFNKSNSILEVKIQTKA